MAPPSPVPIVEVEESYFSIPPRGIPSIGYDDGIRAAGDYSYTFYPLDVSGVFPGMRLIIDDTLWKYDVSGDVRPRRKTDLVEYYSASAISLAWLYAVNHDIGRQCEELVGIRDLRPADMERIGYFESGAPIPLFGAVMDSAYVYLAPRFGHESDELAREIAILLLDVDNAPSLYDFQSMEQEVTP